MKRIGLLLGFAIAPVLINARALADELPKRVESILRSPGFENGHWGLLVVDRKTGAVVYERDADRLFCPASVTKLYSCAAAYVDLGADFRFHTPVVRRGEVAESGVLKGDLILIGRGDPSLGGRTGTDGKLLFEDNDHSYAGGNPNATLVKADPLAGLDQMAREVLAAGIKVVEGGVWVDDRYFETSEATGSGPRRVSPIIVNDNVIDFEITPGEEPGAPARVRAVPSTPSITVESQVETTPAASKSHIDVTTLGFNRYLLRGNIPIASKPVIKVGEVDDPASFARTLLIERLRDRGVRVGASALARNDRSQLPPADVVAALPKVAEYASPPFPESIRVILKVSQNLHASALPLLLGARQGTTTLEAGLKREGAILKGMGVPIDAISLGSGAGGSRADLVSPRATVSLLQIIAKRPDFAAFEAALPILGRDGTLAQSVGPDSAARGHVRAKTGTYYLDNDFSGHPILASKALAGYIDTASGRELVFAFFVNGVPLAGDMDAISESTAAAGRLLGRLCEVFYDDRTGEARSDPPKVPEPAKVGRSAGVAAQTPTPR